MKKFCLILIVLICKPAMAQLPDSIEISQYQRALKKMDVLAVFTTFTNLGDPSITNNENQRIDLVDMLTNEYFVGNDEAWIYYDIDTSHTVSKKKLNGYLNDLNVFWAHATVSYSVTNIKYTNKIYTNNDFLYSPILLDRTLTITENNSIIYKETTTLGVYFKIPIIPNTNGASLIDFSNIKIFQILKHDPKFNFGKEIKIYKPAQKQSTSTVQIENKNVVLNTEKGNLNILTNPKGALITMDGNPTFKELSPYNQNGWGTGDYKISLTKEGYKPLDTIIRIKVNSTNLYEFELKPTFGFLVLNDFYGYDDLKINGVSNKNFADTIVLTEGKYSLEFSKEHYITKKSEVLIKPGKPSKFDVKLQPKNGTLTLISTDKSAVGAEVYLNNKLIGIFPVSNIDTIEGQHQLVLKKKGFGTLYVKPVIEYNKITTVECKLSKYQKVTITTVPEKAEVYFEGKKKGKTPVTFETTIGPHKLEIIHPDFEPLNTNVEILEAKSTPYLFQLKSIRSSVTVQSGLNGTRLEVKNRTQNKDTVIYFDKSKSIKMPYGNYTLKFKRSGYFSETELVDINDFGETVKVKMFPNDNLGFLGITGGPSCWQLSMGFVQNMFYFGVGFGGNIEDYYSIEYDEVMPIINLPSESPQFNYVGNNYLGDSSNVMFFGKIGILLPKPFPFIVNVGGGYSKFSNYYEIVEAQNTFNFYDEDFNYNLISEGERFASNYNIDGHSTGFLSAGIIVPIFYNIYLGLDYNQFPGEAFNFTHFAGTLGIWWHNVYGK